MAQEKSKPAKSPAPGAQVDTERDFQDLGKAGRKGLFGRLNTKFNDAIQSGRGGEGERDAVAETARAPQASADDLAMRRARGVSPKKMIIPEGVIIEGSLAGGSETEIGGRIEGNISVDGRLHLGASALVTGSVSAGSCRVEGLIEGRVECSQELELGKTGRLNADVMAGKQAVIAGQVHGNITTPGVLHLLPSCRVEGDVRARSLLIDDGATLNGQCSMRPPAQRSNKQKT